MEIYFLLSLLFAPTLPSFCEASVDSSEAATLVALHNFCGWDLGWSIGIDACEGGTLGFGWDGIECDSTDRHIEKVELFSRDLPCNLTGLDDFSAFDPSVLTRLMSFTILGSRLSGSLPDAFGALPSLTSLNLDNNALEGSLTNYSFVSPTLATLRMNRNQLSGQLPTSLAANSHLVELDLAYNNLAGPIVSRLSTSAALVYVDLSYNDFDSNLPEFGTQSHLSTLKISGNSFSGTIPEAIGSFGIEGSGLLILHVGGNQLTGTLPQTIRSLTTLQDFDVSDNLLSGHLPALHTMPFAQSEQANIDLSDNKFACPMPSTSAVYDTAQCTCEPGSTGVRGSLDGTDWNATKCRESDGSISVACMSLTRFTCTACSEGQFSNISWSSACRECSPGFFEPTEEATVCSACAVGYFSGKYTL